MKKQEGKLLKLFLMLGIFALIVIMGCSGPGTNSGVDASSVNGSSGVSSDEEVLKAELNFDYIYSRECESTLTRSGTAMSIDYGQPNEASPYDGHGRTLRMGGPTNWCSPVTIGIGDYATYDINLEESICNAVLYFRYSDVQGDFYLNNIHYGANAFDIYLNNENKGSITFGKTGQWSTYYWSSGYVNLGTLIEGQEYELKIVMTNGGGCGINLDVFKIVESSNAFTSIWNMDEVDGGIVSDIGVNGNDGQFVNNVSSVNGISNKALNFDGGYVEVTNPSNIPIGDSSYTIEAWIKPDSMGQKCIVGWGDFDHFLQNQITTFRLTNDGLMNSWFANDLTVYTGDISGSWHHVVATYDGSVRKIYLDGICCGQDMPSGRNVPAGPLYIGKGFDSSLFDGIIDEVVIYDRGLTAEEVLNNYNYLKTKTHVVEYNMDEGSGEEISDSSGNNNNGILYGGIGFSSDSISGYSLDFDGIDDYATTSEILAGLPQGDNSYTISAWINPYMVFSQCIVSWGNKASNEMNELYIDESGIYNSWNGDELFAELEEADLLADSWHNIVATYDGVNRKIYLDGVCIAADIPSVPNFQAVNFKIGSSNACPIKFWGKIDNVDVYNIALTEAEIQASYNENNPY